MATQLEIKAAKKALADSMVDPKPNRSTKVSDWLDPRDIERAVTAALEAAESVRVKQLSGIFGDKVTQE